MKISHLKNCTISGMLLMLFMLFTYLLSKVDVGTIGPNNSQVGFSGINALVSRTIGVNMMLYTITDWLGVIVVLVAFGFATCGAIQMISRKSLKNVDHSILELGILYGVVIAAYLFFESNIINCRPVLIEDKLEASYPSSTTMLTITVMSTSIIQFKRLIKNKIAKRVIIFSSTIFTVFMIVGRVLSGVHWITDIFGAILLSATFVMTYYSVSKYVDSKTTLPKENSV